MRILAVPECCAFSLPVSVSPRWSSKDARHRFVGPFLDCQLGSAGKRIMVPTRPSRVDMPKSARTELDPLFVESPKSNKVSAFETESSGPTIDDDDVIVDESLGSAVRGGSASIPNLTISLIKSIVGSGVLALPAGMATIGDVPSSVVPVALALVAVTGSLNAYFFTIIGRVCGATGATSFQQAWDKSVGQHSSAVTWVISLKTFLSCLAFSMILADSLSSLMSLPRTLVLWVVTVTAILPLTLLKDLKSLAPFSALGLAGMGVASSTMILRWLDKSYQPGGPYALAVPEALQPEFGVSGGPHWEGIVLACSLATAFMAHYNAPRFHAELSNNTNERFQLVTLASYGVAALLFGLIACAGFLTFGGHSQGFILNNYAATDPLIATSRIALAASILLTYPLPFVGLRDGCFDLLKSQNASLMDEEQKESLVLPVTLGLLLSVTIAATFLRDLGLVIAVGGGTFSTAVSSVFPALMLNGLNEQRGGQRSLDVTVAWTGMWISVAIGVTGVGLALAKAFTS